MNNITVRKALGSRPIVGALASIATLGVAGAAYAVAAGGGGTVVKACYKTAAPYTLSLKPTGSACPAGTTALSWNTLGPQGPQGIQGLQGPQGSPGLSEFQTVAGSTGFVPPGNLAALDVPCPSGETAISGGYTVPYTVTVLESHPRSGDPSTWSVVAAFPSQGGVLTVYVQCAVVTTAGSSATSAHVGAPAPRVHIEPLSR
jgi:hypothetical protein